MDLFRFISHPRAVGSYLAGVLVLFAYCQPGPKRGQTPAQPSQIVSPSKLQIEISRPVTIERYFRFMDSVVAAYQPQVSYPLSEHLLVHANPWILDTLAATDYYRRMARDSFVYDQRQQIALPQGHFIEVPDSAGAARINERLRALHLDINIPEFRLRILEDSVERHAFPIRVGQNRTRYLKMGDRETDLRTLPGQGRIVRHERNPVFYNPVDRTRYYSTLRDDKKRTLMPRIPWLETEINGRRNGQLIHPTTNPETLGRAYSNGCIGTGEAAAWIIYYHAPLGTPVSIRYDLKVAGGPEGPTELKEIYGWGEMGPGIRP